MAAEKLNESGGYTSFGGSPTRQGNTPIATGVFSRFFSRFFARRAQPALVQQLQAPVDPNNPESVDELRKIGQSFSVPLLVNRPPSKKTPWLSSKELEGLGFKIVIFPGYTNTVVEKALIDLFTSAPARWFPQCLN